MYFVKFISSEGAGCEAFGHGELYAALACGVRPELTNLNGDGKSEDLLRKAIEAGVRITVIIKLQKSQLD